VGKKWLDGLNQGQVGLQEGNDFVRMQGVRGEVDDRSGQAFGHWEIAGLKPPAVQAGLNRVQGGTEPVAQGDPGLFGRRLEGWAIGGDQLTFTDFGLEWKWDQVLEEMSFSKPRVSVLHWDFGFRRRITKSRRPRKKP